MFFFRDPYYRPSPAEGCLSSLFCFLIFGAIFAVLAIYIGAYVLLGLLIVGAIVGGLMSVFAMLKAIPQTVQDMSAQNFRGSKITVVLKQIGYFFVCIGKYSLYNDYQYAMKAYQRFSANRVLSLTKWINLALAVAVLAIGVVILLAILFCAVMLTVATIIAAFDICLVAIVLLLGIGLVYNLVIAAKNTIVEGLKALIPTCFLFRGKRHFADLLMILKRFSQQISAWIAAIWNDSLNVMNRYKLGLSSRHWILYPLVIALIATCPISALAAIALMLVLVLVIWIVVYLIDAIWIVFRATFRI